MDALYRRFDELKPAANRKSIDWVSLYAYPLRLAELRPGEVGIFVCPHSWSGRLGTVCGVWIKGHTDWAAVFPPGTPWTEVFWTEAVAEGLQVVRAQLPDRDCAYGALRFKCSPCATKPASLEKIFAKWSASGPMEE